MGREMDWGRIWAIFFQTIVVMVLATLLYSYGERRQNDDVCTLAGILLVVGSMQGTIRSLCVVMRS